MVQISVLHSYTLQKGIATDVIKAREVANASGRMEGIGKKGHEVDCKSPSSYPPEPSVTRTEVHFLLLITTLTVAQTNALLALQTYALASPTSPTGSPSFDALFNVLALLAYLASQYRLDSDSRPDYRFLLGRYIEPAFLGRLGLLLVLRISVRALVGVEIFSLLGLGTRERARETYSAERYQWILDTKEYFP